jgi:hypothetical protein
VRVAQVQPPAFDLAADRLAGVVADGPAGADDAGSRRRRQPEIAASTVARTVNDPAAVEERESRLRDPRR